MNSDGSIEGQAALYRSQGSTSSVSSPQQSVKSEASSTPEYCAGPLSLSVCISDTNHEILRPKPRRYTKTNFLFSL